MNGYGLHLLSCEWENNVSFCFAIFPFLYGIFLRWGLCWYFFFLRGKSQLASTMHRTAGLGWGAFDGSMHNIAKRSGCGLPCNNVRLKKVIEMFVGLTCTQC